jgi:hypothetical protein
MLIDALPCPRCGSRPTYQEDRAVCPTPGCDFRGPGHYVSEWDLCADGWDRHVLEELRENGE